MKISDLTKSSQWWGFDLKNQYSTFELGTWSIEPNKFHLIWDDYELIEQGVNQICILPFDETCVEFVT